ncbi:hypothetical protein ANN_11348, partial [Periplaneta americana]
VAYAVQKGRDKFSFSPNDYKTFLGILLVSGYAKVLRRRIYWEESSDTRNESIVRAMRCNRFDEIMRNLHLNGSTQLDNSDRLSKKYRNGYQRQYGTPKSRPSLTVTPVSSRVAPCVRFDERGHIIITQQKRTRCAVCKSQTTKRCLKCDVALYDKCFQDFIFRNNVSNDVNNINFSREEQLVITAERGTWDGEIEAALHISFVTGACANGAESPAVIRAVSVITLWNYVAHEIAVMTV